MRSRSLLLLLAVAPVVVLACDDDGSATPLRPAATGTPSATAAPDPGDSEQGGEGGDDTEAQEPVSTPAPDPGPSETVPPSPTEPEDDDSSLLPILFGIGLLVLAGVVVGALAGRRGKSDTPPTPAAAATPATPSPQVALLTTAQWIHDHLTLELLAVPPADALARWATERRRLDDVAIGAQEQYANGRGEGWSGLSATMATLASALDTNLRLRAQSPPDPALIQESTAVVNRQRAVLGQQVATLWPGATRTTTTDR